MLLIDYALVKILCFDLKEKLLSALNSKTLNQLGEETIKKSVYLISILEKRRVNATQNQEDCADLYKQVIILFLNLLTDGGRQITLARVENLQTIIKLHPSDPAVNLLLKPILSISKFVSSNVYFLIDHTNAEKDEFKLTDDLQLIDLMENNVKLNEWPKCKILLLRHDIWILQRDVHLLLSDVQVDG